MRASADDCRQAPCRSEGVHGFNVVPHIEAIYRDVLAPEPTLAQQSIRRVQSASLNRVPFDQDFRRRDI